MITSDSQSHSATQPSPAELTPSTPTSAPASTTTSDVIALAQLWSDQFQHMTSLAVAGAGGMLLLLQVGVMKQPRWWLSIVPFIVAAFLGITGQAWVVDEATNGVLPGRGLRVLRGLTFAAFGAGLYAAVRLFT